MWAILGALLMPQATDFFQEVVTHPAYRRQGICRSLTYYAAQYALKSLGAAKRIYGQLGFAETERQVGMLVKRLACQQAQSGLAPEVSELGISGKVVQVNLSPPELVGEVGCQYCGVAVHA